MTDQNNEFSSLTLNGVVYRTNGNILFGGEEECYYVAESALLDKFDHAIENGILVNGMRSLMKRLKS